MDEKPDRIYWSKSRVQALDDIAQLPVSRQRKWQLRQSLANKCSVCGKPARIARLVDAKNKLCKQHAYAENEYQKAKRRRDA